MSAQAWQIKERIKPNGNRSIVEVNKATEKSLKTNANE